MKIAADALILPCVSFNLAMRSTGFAGRKVWSRLDCVDWAPGV